MSHSIRRFRYPFLLALLTGAILVAVLTPSGLRAQIGDNDRERQGSVFDLPADAPNLDHDPIEDSAALDGAAAERIYRSILPQMQGGYSASGDPLVWAYVRWQRFNAVPYRSHQHGMVFVNNYANPVAADYGRLDAVEQLPEGSLIVKDSFVVTESGEIRAGALAIMEKMPAGFDPENGDWRYLVVTPGGTMAGITGDDTIDPRMAQCAACHNAAPEGQDRLFDVPEEVRR